MRAWPSVVALTVNERPSEGSATRSTSLASSNRATMRVADGRWMRSSRASSLGVSGPWRSIVASADVWDGPRSVPASCRRRRAVLVITSRSWAASPLRSRLGASASRIVAIANYLSELLLGRSTGLSPLAQAGELPPGARVGDLIGGQPGAPRGREAVDDVAERVRSVSVGVDADHHPGLGCEARVALREVAAVGIAVDLEHGPGASRRRRHALDVYVVGLAAVDQPPRQMADAVDERVLGRGDDPLGHRAPGDLERGVDARHHPVQLPQEVLLVVRRPVQQDVDL